MTRLAIFGAGGHGRVTAEAAHRQGWNSITFFDDRWPELTNSGQWMVEGNYDSLLGRLDQFSGLVVGIGDNFLRLRKVQELLEKGASLVTVIHPRAILSDDSIVERGTVICGGAVVNVGARVGVGCIINSNATIEHDCLLAPGVHIGPGVTIGGTVSIGECSWIGIGANVRNNLRIGREAIVGGGAMVINDVQDCTTVLGVPARPRDIDRDA